MKFSLVIPVYKTEHLLDRMLESVKDQSYQDWEAIVVFDGESDKFEGFCKKYFDDNRIKFLKKSNGGVCSARNMGMDKATGDYVAFPSSDFELKPDCLMIWKESFEKNPDVDFIYGDYLMWRYDREGRVMPGYMQFKSRPFDKDALLQSNYIDGAFPIKKTSIGNIRWDEGMKSLNDWEWWIAHALAGKKGVFIPGYTFVAEPPKPHGLSHDSHNNWSERFNYIYKKHNLHKPSVNVFSLGTIFGEKIGKMMGWHYNLNVMHKNYKYKHIHFLGFYESHIQDYINVIASNSDSTFSCHLIGTDIFEMLSYGSPQIMDNLKDTFFNKMKFVATEYKETNEFVNRLGIRNKIVPLPVEPVEFTDEKRDRYTVAVYTPVADEDKYSTMMMNELVLALPMINFVFFGDRRTKKDKHMNLENLGWVNGVSEPLAKSDCLLRITPTDGLSISAIEWLLAKKQVITNHKVTGAIYLDKCNFDTDSSCDEIMERIMNTILDLSKGEKVKTNGRFTNIYTKERFLENFKEVM